MTPFQTGRLAELARVRSGYAFKSADWTIAGEAVLRIGNIRAGAVDLDGCAFVSKSTAEMATDFEVAKGDVLIAMSGATVGKIGRVRFATTALLNQRVGRFEVTDLNRLDTGFLYYFLQLSSSNEYLVGAAYGSAQPNISPSLIVNQQIPLPNLSEQRAIAEVLGALDDKIAANTNLARSSLEISSAIFQSHVRGIARSASRFSDVAKISGGGTPSTKVPEFWAGDINWATPSDVTALAGPYLRSTSRQISDEGLQACSSSLFQPGAILMTSRATIGAFAIAQTATAVNQGFIVVEPIHEYMRYWLFHEMHSRVDEFLSLANGATFLELSRGNFKKLPVRLAEPEVLNSFAEVAGSLHSSAAAAHRENETLAETRDALLPQLMSGKLRVRDAENAVEAVV